MENIKFGIQQNLHFSTYGIGTITLRNPEFNYNGIILTVDGEVGFEDFDKIVHNKVFNFDPDFIRPLDGGSILIVSKPVSLKCGLHPSICAEILEGDFDEEILRRVVTEYIKTEEEFLLSENWCAFTLSQKKGEKLIGHETIWNTIDYSNPDLVENWEAITGQAAMPFVVGNEELFNKIREEQGDGEEDLKYDEFKQFQEFLSDENNPLGDMLSKITEAEGEGDLQNILGEMSNLLSNFEGIEGEEESHEISEFENIIANYLEEEEIEYTYDEENTEFLAQFEIDNKFYEVKIVQYSDYYLTISTKYPQSVNIERDSFLYKFMNVVNSKDLVGKIYFEEKNKSIFVQTSLILTFEVDEAERVIDTIDENLDLCNRVFPILQSLINGIIDVEEAIIKYDNISNGEDNLFEDLID